MGENIIKKITDYVEHQLGVGCGFLHRENNYLLLENGIVMHMTVDNYCYDIDLYDAHHRYSKTVGGAIEYSEDGDEVTDTTIKDAIDCATRAYAYFYRDYFYYCYEHDQDIVLPNGTTIVISKQGLSKNTMKRIKDADPHVWDPIFESI